MWSSLKTLSWFTFKIALRNRWRSFRLSRTSTMTSHLNKLKRKNSIRVGSAGRLDLSTTQSWKLRRRWSKVQELRGCNQERVERKSPERSHHLMKKCLLNPQMNILQSLKKSHQSEMTNGMMNAMCARRMAMWCAVRLALAFVISNALIWGKSQLENGFVLNAQSKGIGVALVVNLVE